jgi:hypothetical protein
MNAHADADERDLRERNLTRPAGQRYEESIGNAMSTTR